MDKRIGRIKCGKKLFQEKQWWAVLLNMSIKNKIKNRIINLSQMIYDFIIWLYDLKVKLNIA